MNAQDFFKNLKTDYINAVNIANIRKFKDEQYITSLQNSLIKYNDIQKLTTYYSILTPEVKQTYNKMYTTIKQIFDDYGGSRTKSHHPSLQQPVAVPSRI